MSTPEIEVFWASGSPYSWRVLLALELKGVPYTSHLLSFARGDLKTPEYLALNPRGRVPTLRAGSYVVYESVAVLTWLDRRYPEPPLFGHTPEEAGTISRVISEYSAYVDPHVEALIPALYFGQLEGNEERVRHAVRAIAAELSGLDRALDRGSWITGNAVSAADLVWFPAVQTLQRAAAKPVAAPLDLDLLPIARRWPSVAAWMKRIEDLPGYDVVYPPHWKL